VKDLKPAEMTKISITGHQEHLQQTINELYGLKLLDISRYEGEFETGNPFEDAEELSRLLVESRSLLSKLPEVESTDESFELATLDEDLNKIQEELEAREGEIAGSKTDLELIDEKIRVLRGLKGSDLNVEDLGGTENLGVKLIKDTKFSFDEDRERAEVIKGKSYSLIVFERNIEDETSSLVSENDLEEVKVPNYERKGEISEVIESLQQKKSSLENKIEKLEKELDKEAKHWKGKLEAAEEFLSEKVAKAEAPLNFAMSERAFIAEGWLPEEDFQELGESLHEKTNGHVHIQTEPAEEEPPTKHENSKPVQPFESLTDLVSVPRHNEIDPSIVLMLTFPLFFGFMIGDAGYGLTTLAVFYGGYKLVPEAKEIFKSLMYASIATIIFGLAFGDAFGYVIFGHHSELAAATGIHLFEKIPILFHRAEHLGQVFTIAAIIGLVHVNLGYLIGFYNEYVRHGLKEAFLEKISWILIEIGAFATYVYGIQVGGPILLISVFSLYLGEGIEGIVEIPSLLSNILSYLRIFGVSVAAVALAAVVNAMADPLFQMNSPVGFALGTTVLVIGHVFNTFIKIMEGFLQGIRLHYVEMFSKFYEGGGRKYVPFGTK